jgi:hypothetical protein
MGLFSSPKKSRKKTLAYYNSQIEKEEKKFAIKQAKGRLATARKKNRGY